MRLTQPCSFPPVRTVDNIFVFFLTGMEEASCEKAAFVSNYLPHTSDFEVIQGPAARIRPKRLPEDYFSCEFLSSLPSLMQSCFKPCCLSFVSFLSRLRRASEEPLGMPNIPSPTLCIDKKNEKLSACVTSW